MPFSTREFFKKHFALTIAAIWTVCIGYYTFNLQAEHDKEMAAAQQTLLQRSKHIEGIEHLNTQLAHSVRAVVVQMVDGEPLSEDSVANVRNILLDKSLLANNLLTSFPENSDEREAIVAYQVTVDTVRRNLNQLAPENGVSQKTFLQSVADMLEEQNKLLMLIKSLPLTQESNTLS